MTLYKRVNRKVIYSNDWVELYIDSVKYKNVYIPEYHIIHHPRESVVILVTRNGKILFEQAVRYISNALEIELPAGYIEVDETPLEAAKREVLEEAGIVCKDLRLIYSFYPSNGMSDQIVHVVRADYEQGIEKNQLGETEELFWKSKEEINDMIKSKQIVDGITLVALSLMNLFT